MLLYIMIQHCLIVYYLALALPAVRSMSLPIIKIHQRGVQWKQGVVVHIKLKAVLLHNTTPIHCTPSDCTPL